MTLPVIIVPGIMGTRLADTRGRSLWDPDDGITISNIRGVAKLRDPRERAVPHPSAGAVLDALFAARGVVNGGHLVWDKAYKNLVMELSDPRMTRICGERVKVYCAGYDWRQSNIASVRLLRQVVERALRETRNNKVVLIAHSMGGLVSRLFCKYSQINGRPARGYVAQLQLLGSPIHGASKAYRALRQSFVSPDDIADIPIDNIEEGVFDFAGRAVASMIKRFPSVYELLPTNAFCRANPDWLRFDTRRARLSNAADPRLVYRNRVTGLSAPPAMLVARDTLDAGLGAYLPSSSVIIYGSQLETETMFRIQSDGDLERAGGTRRNLGDGTVPTFSGKGQAGSRSLPRVNLGRTSHGGVASDRRAIAEIKRQLAGLCVT